MVNLNAYVILKEDMDADNLSWKVSNWATKLSDDEKVAFDTLKSDALSSKDMKAFKDAVDKSKIDFKALVSAVADDATNTEQIDDLYIMKKIIDTINIKDGKK